MADRKGELTIAMLGLKPKRGSSSSEEMDADKSGLDPEDPENPEEEDDETPLGLVEAMGELRSAQAAEDDEAMAKAFHRALKCCDAC